MPEISDADFRQFVAYQQLGSPQEVAKKIGDLEADNKQQRDEIRDLKGKVPAEDAVVLAAADAQALEAYRALGKPEELTQAIGERDELRQKDAERTRQDAWTRAAKAMGWAEDAALTLLDMRSLDGATVEVKREKNEQGEDVEVPYVTLAGEGQKEQKLADFAASAPQLRGLKTEGAPAPASAPPTGRPFVPQTNSPTRREGKVSDEDHRKAVEQTASYAL